MKKQNGPPIDRFIEGSTVTAQSAVPSFSRIKKDAFL